MSPRPCSERMAPGCSTACCTSKNSRISSGSTSHPGGSISRGPVSSWGKWAASPPLRIGSSGAITTTKWSIWTTIAWIRSWFLPDERVQGRDRSSLVRVRSGLTSSAVGVARCSSGSLAAFRHPHEGASHERHHRPAAHHAQEIDGHDHQGERCRDIPSHEADLDGLHVLYGEDRDGSQEGQEEDGLDDSHDLTYERRGVFSAFHSKP